MSIFRAVQSAREQVVSALAVRAFRAEIPDLVRGLSDVPAEMTVRLEIPGPIESASGEVPRRDPLDSVQRLIV